MVDTEEESGWAAPFHNLETSTAVPYGDLHTASPFVATPQKAIDLLLKTLEVSSDDFLVDLGCGHGTINITAAKEYGTAGLGVDIEQDLVDIANKSAQQLNLSSLVEFRVEDVLYTDLTRATAVASFLVRSPRTSLGMMVELQDADALFPELDQEAFPQHDPFICKMDSDTLSILLDGFVPAQEATVHEGSITSATESVSSDQEAEEEEAAATLEGEAPFDAFAPPNLSNHWNLFPPGSVIGLDTTMKASFNPSSAGRGASKGPSAQRANASRKGRVSKRRNTSSAERPCTRCRYAKVLCDRGYPCTRCSRLGLECCKPKYVQRGRPSKQRLLERAAATAAEQVQAS